MISKGTAEARYSCPVVEAALGVQFNCPVILEVYRLCPVIGQDLKCACIQRRY